MTGRWITHHKGTVAGRKVEVQTHSEGGYRVRTTQGDDYPGSVSVDQSSTIIIPPSEQGSPVDLEGETIEEVREGLIGEGFSAEQAEEVLAHFP